MQNVWIGEKRISKLVEAIRALIKGRSHHSGTVTLTQNAATTTVTSRNIAAGYNPQLTPASAAAAAEVASVYVSSVTDGSFVIAHPNNATAGRTWHWNAMGD